MFPYNATTKYQDFTANGTFQVLPSGFYTIHHASLFTTADKATVMDLKCGTASIIDNHKNDVVQVPMMYKCNDSISVVVSAHNAGGEDVVITYTTHETATSTYVSADSVMFSPFNLTQAGQDYIMFLGVLIFIYLMIYRIFTDYFSL